MSGRRELGFPKATACSLKEQLARTTVQNVKAQGHTYIDLREDGKRFIFFCTLCLSPCYSDTVLFDHLQGSLHTKRLSAAKVTLLKSNPWPFDDGVAFFNNCTEKDKGLAILDGSQSRLLESQSNDNNLAIVQYAGNLKANLEGPCGLDGNHLDGEVSSSFMNLTATAGFSELVIPNVLIKENISDLRVKFIGFGQIAARFREKDVGSNEISRIWCEWLGKKGLIDEGTFRAPEHDYAVITFSYEYDLGRMGLFDDVKLLLSSSLLTEIENGEGANRKRKKSFSDPEDVSESLSNHGDSSGEDSFVSNSPSSRLLGQHNDDQLLHRRFISNKAARRELRRQQRLAAERMCDICQHKMLPKKDVATLMNMRTGKLACSSRNVNGAFHVYHTSCLVHWILLCEFEIMSNQSVSPKLRRKSKRKNQAKADAGDDVEAEAKSFQIRSVLCPGCQGTGVDVEGDELEKAVIPLSEIFKYKIKVSEARRAWMECPEVLKNCSTGFRFRSQSEDTEIKEKVSLLKVIRFYGVDEYSLS